MIIAPYIYFPGSEGNIDSHGTLRVKFTYCKLNEATVISSVDEETLCFEPFRIDKYHNKGKEDEIACEGVSICCLCVAAAHIMKPMS